MKKEEIIIKVRQMKTVDDLARLLNEIKPDQFGSNKYTISANKLLHFSNPNIVPNRYKTFKIVKKNGKTREINAPCSQLKKILEVLNILFKAIYKPSESAMGFAEGRNVVDNALNHVGHHYVFNIDLKDFFPSIPQARVRARIQYAPFGFTKEIANVISGLCCTTSEDKSHNVLPQGAPTSPLLTNAICDKLDYKMRGVAKRFGLHYSRYADDMSFSSMHNVYQENSEFRLEIDRVIKEQGFVMNNNKTRLLRDGQRQEVTGLVVNTKVNIEKRYIEDLRLWLHIWDKYGYAKAYAYFYPRYKQEKGYIKKGEPVMENVIGGKLEYLCMVKGKNNECYKRLKQKFDQLQQVVYVDLETDKGKSYVYVQPYSIMNFESLFGTKISLYISQNHKLIGKCTLAKKDKIVAISKSTQKYICPNIESVAVGSEFFSEKLKNCHISLCRSKGKNFWLITAFKPLRSKCLSIQNVNINVQEILDIWESQGIDKAANMFNKTLFSPIEGEDGNKVEPQDIIHGVDDFPRLSLEDLEEGNVLDEGVVLFDNI